MNRGTWQERRAFKSQAARLIEHLLKFAFASPSAIKANQRFWRLSLRGSRREISEILAESPGLRSSVQDLFSKAWLDGRDEALKFLKVDDDAIPESPLWDFEEAIDEKFEPAK
jgi:hypothetical protein